MRRVKHLLTYVLVLSMCFTLFFIPKYSVYAENPTYFEVDANECFQYMYTDSPSGSIGFIHSQIPFRCGYYLLGSNALTFYVVASSDGYNLNNSYKGTSSGTNATCPTGWESRRWSYNVATFNGVQYGFYRYAVNYDPAPNIQVIHTNTDFSYEDMYRYTYGDLAVDPEPPGPTWGKPYYVEYATRIAGSGLASADNIDRIVWNRAVDTNGNELPTGARVQIRAIPGKYVGNTANDVLTKTYTDFVLDHSKQLIIVDIIASRGVYETKWSEVVDHFGFFPYSWVPNIQYIDNEYFKMGWIYQIRLQVDDYYSDWTNIYTATGSGASESQTITDSDEISQQLVQDINIVNQLNNTTTTNWYINETTINNSEYTENTNGKPWWAYLLEAILSLFQIGDGEQQTINNTNNLNIDLNDKLNEYNEIEDQQLNNLDTNLEAIEVESDMLENNKFVGSANWVAQQYSRMTNGTVIGSLIGFSLLFGLALIFIGKIR